MAGKIVVTGANSSLAIPAVQHLLANYPHITAILTVRDSSDNDINTKKPRTTIAQHPSAKTSTRELDLADLPATFQVVHIAHAALVLRLLGTFSSDGGRIVLFSSDAHYPGKNSLEKYPPAIPNNLELFAKPAADDPPDNLGRGFQRYAESKLAVVMWMYTLNRYLETDPKLRTITAVAINPGNLSDSRGLRTRTPRMLVFLSMFIMQPLRPLLRFLDPTMRLSAEAGADVVELATGRAHPHERGYFTLLEKDVRAPESMDEATQQGLWEKTLQWAGIGREKTALAVAC